MLKSVGFPSTRTGDQTIVNGNEVFATAGKGIDFSANANAPGMTSELLNWYEEGTWTPVIKGTTSAGTGTYSVQTGTYTRVGDIVYVQLFLVWTAHTGTGNMFLDGLPFTSENTSFAFHGVTIGQFENIALTAGSTPMGYIANNSTQITLRQMPSGGGAMSDVPMDTAGNMIISASYKV